MKFVSHFLGISISSASLTGLLFWENEVKYSVAGVDYRFTDPQLLREALTHKSAGVKNYERLEFLGDSVLGLVVSSRLYELRPDAREGDLSRMRARLVRGVTLTDLALGMGLGKQVNLGEGELKSGGFRRASILADTLEAVFGAVFLDGGYEACRHVITDLFDPLIENLPTYEELKDAKTRLQEWLQARARPLPLYTLQREEGADHAKTFYVSCEIPDDGARIEASGDSRRKAEQAAATLILKVLQESQTS
jgi:ribonuclease-3